MSDLVASWRGGKEKEYVAPCPRCSGPTIHYCGMGACFDRCPRCDPWPSDASENRALEGKK